MTVGVIVHPGTLLGKELRERLGVRPGLFAELRLLSTREDEVGTLTEVGGSAAFVGRADVDGLAGASLVFFCGGEGESELAAQLPATARAVWLQQEGTAGDDPPAVAGLSGDPWDGRTAVASPHPAVVGAALVVAPLLELGLRSVAGTALVPVSTHGEGGIAALSEETRALLTFAPRRGHAPFAAQIAFNVLPDPALSALAERQLAALFDGSAELTLQLARAGIFHGVTLALHVRLGPGTSAADLRRRWSQAPHLEMVRGRKPLSALDAAGGGSVLVSEPRSGGAAGGFWIWAVLDNLTRGGAWNALELAESWLGSPGPPS